MNPVEFLLVRLGDRRVGLPLSELVEVIETGPCHPIPSADPAVRGVLTVRGRPVPLIQLSAFLADRPATGPVGDTAVVLRAGAHPLALEVDDAEAVVREPALPVPPEAPLPWAMGVVRRPDGLIPLLDLPALSARLTDSGVRT